MDVKFVHDGQKWVEVIIALLVAVDTIVGGDESQMMKETEDVVYMSLDFLPLVLSICDINRRKDKYGTSNG